MNDEIRRRFVGGDWNIVHHRDSQQRFDVGVVRLAFERVPKENDDIYLPLRDFCADLLVATKRAGQIAFYGQIRRLRNEFCRRARTAKRVPFQRFFVL